ncbi:EAL domain-containing protein, partial [Shigella flexneri]|nr:EAL domain-containing protein [Shigella flexneri]
TLAIGLSIAAGGAALTWYQVAETDLSRTAAAAHEAVSVTERLLDEAQGAIDLVYPLSVQPCTPQLRTELGRLTISHEHIRVINIFNQNLLSCSSWEGADPVREFISAGDNQTLILATDDYISPGVPVMILRKTDNDNAITASIATKWVADNMTLLNLRRPLSLRVGNTVLTSDNTLVKAIPRGNRHAVYSGLYPFSIEYPGDLSVPLTLYFHDGALSLLLSVLLGAAVATGLWKIKFRRKSRYDEIYEAMRKDEIVPWYQPIMDASTGEIAGVEVLARWVKADGEVIYPGSFITEVERSDLVIPLTRSLMARASRDLPPLTGDGKRWHISFNITQSHIMETGFIAECLTFIDAFTPGSITLTIEPTEREPFDNSDEMRCQLKRIHDAGIALALDDFGTGYANMEYLSEIPVDIIKIDRVFVNRIGQGESAEHLLTSLIEMANTLKKEIIAEGVETEAQAAWLYERGVGKLQGFLYSPALPPDKLALFKPKMS